MTRGGKWITSWPLAICLAITTQAGWAQEPTPPAGWNCSAEVCIEAAASVFATFTGTFAHGAALEGTADADRIAALEQQGLRRFEFTVREPARIEAELAPDRGYRPSDWPAGAGPAKAPALRMLASADGERFETLAKGEPARPGDRLLVTLRQARTGGGATAVTYHPARWTLRLSQRRLLPPSDAAQAADPMPPAIVSADGDPAPGDLAAKTPDVPAVEGSANQTELETGCVGTDCGGASPAADADALASELQRELMRLGCYRAAVDGLWGPASRAALAEFADRTGAELDPGAPSPAALVAVAQSAAPVCPND